MTAAARSNATGAPATKDVVGAASEGRPPDQHEAGRRFGGVRQSELSTLVRLSVGLFHLDLRFPRHPSGVAFRPAPRVDAHLSGLPGDDGFFVLSQGVWQLSGRALTVRGQTRAGVSISVPEGRILANGSL